jgi:hypothetical protein
VPALLEGHTISVDLGHELFRRWQAGGSAGEGFHVRDGNLQLSRDGAWIGNLEIKPSEFHTFSVTFDRKPKKLQGNDVFFLDVTQTVDDHKAEILGGQSVSLKTVYDRRHPPHLPWCIFGHWTHSHEEDENDEQVFRHHAYPFPPSRDRDGFELTEDGVIILHEITRKGGTQRLAAT